MDERAVNHLQGATDALAFHDYRDISAEPPPDISAYAAVDVVAWSMGVWTASALLGRWGIVPRRAVALNGTERPVDDHLGIPAAIYALTERGMNQRGWEKFLARLLDDDSPAFTALHRPLRPLPEQVEELRRVREQAVNEPSPLAWDKAYISANDRIFPQENQQNFWQGRCPIVRLAGGHYPFFRLPRWDLIMNYEDR
jgi:biotin synthesis protein BioG